MQNLLEEIAKQQRANDERLKQIEKYTLLAAKNVLTADDVVLLTGMSKSYLYKLTCAHQIPFYKPIGKCIFFDKREIEDWQRQNRSITDQEAQQFAISKQ